MPSPWQLEVLVAVARTGSASAAARAVHVTQPAVTQAIRTLEKALESKLFSRSARGMVATVAGKAGVRRAERALAQLKVGVAEAAPAGRGRLAGSLRGISITQLEYLLAVVRENGFGRAARARGVARATLHRAARQLERVIDAPLFERTSHGIRPTRDAERFVRRVRLAVAEMRQCRAELAAMRGQEGGDTVIGAMPLARSLFMPAVIAEFSRGFPRHSVSVIEGPYEGMLDSLRAGDADILVGALRADPPPDVSQEHLFDDPLSIIARADHPLARGRGALRRRPELRRLARFPWVVARRGTPLWRAFEQIMAGRDPHSAAAPVVCSSWVVARSLLVATNRLMLLSAHQAYREIESGELVALRLPAGEISRPIGVTTRRDWQPTLAQGALLACIRARARAASECRPAVWRRQG